MLKYIKVLQHVSILTDHHQGVGMYFIKVAELFKNDDDLLRSKHVGVLLRIFMYFNIEIIILD